MKVMRLATHLLRPLTAVFISLLNTSFPKDMERAAAKGPVCGLENIFALTIH